MRKKRKYNKTRNDTNTKKRKVAKIKIRKGAAPKTRNGGTMTEQGFWNMIRQLLRRRTMFWLPILNTKNKAKILYKGINKKRKYSYICQGCGQEFASNQVNVHHEIEVGSLTCAEDLPGFVSRLFCEDGLKLLCHNCHDKEHKK